jgi:predicted HicB family RNase H-like nuclease
MKQLEYMGYVGSIEIDTDNDLLHGKLLYITDVITYAGYTAKELKAAFEEAVNDYLQICAELGDTPNVPLKGVTGSSISPIEAPR